MTLHLCLTSSLYAPFHDHTFSLMCRFEYCKCKGGCKTRTCPCLSAWRECDPDHCRNCFDDCKHDDAKGDDKRKARCENKSIQHGMGVTLLVGKSVIEGWGAFASRFIKKGEFVS